jgi:5-methylcytosine-specific restriction protein A
MYKIEDITNKILNGDALLELRKIPDESISCVMTSPPYWALEIFINQEGYTIVMRDKRNGRFLKGYTYRKEKPFWNKEWLFIEYISKGKSAQEIADENNCINNNILFWLNKHNIKRRNISESRKLKYWGQKGEDNPMWNKKGELNHNWKGGITPERQGFYQSQEWKDTCRFVWNRDKGICQRCKIKNNEGVPFHIHHIISFKNKETRSNPDNFILLCKICHNYVHSKSNKNREFIGGGEKI